MTVGLSFFLGDATNSVVIAVILLVSVGLGFSNEFLAESAAEALHPRVAYTVVALRQDRPGLGERQPQTEFQNGLKRFSFLRLQVAVALTTLIFIANLLPAVVITCLAAGTWALAKRKVLVKRLVCIEDLGDMDVLVTDKTGPLTTGHISIASARPVRAEVAEAGLFVLGLVSTEADYSHGEVSTLGANPLDTALWGAPEDVMALCVEVPPHAQSLLDKQYDAGARVIAVASRQVVGMREIAPADKQRVIVSGCSKR